VDGKMIVHGYLLYEEYVGMTFICVSTDEPEYYRIGDIVRVERDREGILRIYNRGRKIAGIYARWELVQEEPPLSIEEIIG
jgi:hypothetical protein